jgi:hypothetical protein
VVYRRVPKTSSGSWFQSWMVLTSSIMENITLWDMTLCSLVEVQRSLGKNAASISTVEEYTRQAVIKKQKATGRCRQQASSMIKKVNKSNQ